MTNTIIQSLNWRYATKKFDTTRKVSDTDLQQLLEALRLSPSSFGLQPWHFFVITDQKLRAKLAEHAWNQPQIVDASHLIVLCARTDLNEAYVKNYVKEIAVTHKIPLDSLKGYQDMMLGFINGKTKEELIAWAKKQVYISLGILIESCAQMNIDSCPMEGFDNEKFDELLALKNMTTAVLCPIGYRSKNDHVAQLTKVRFKQNEIITRL